MSPSRSWRHCQPSTASLNRTRWPRKSCDSFMDEKGEVTGTSVTMGFDAHGRRGLAVMNRLHISARDHCAGIRVSRLFTSIYEVRGNHVRPSSNGNCYRAQLGELARRSRGVSAVMGSPSRYWISMKRPAKSSPMRSAPREDRLSQSQSMWATRSPWNEPSVTSPKRWARPPSSSTTQGSFATTCSSRCQRVTGTPL